MNNISTCLLYIFSDDYQPVDWANWAPHDQQQDVIEFLWANCGKVTRAANWAWSMEICENEYTFICEYGKKVLTSGDKIFLLILVLCVLFIR